MHEHEIGRRLSVLEDRLLQQVERIRRLERIEEFRHRGVAHIREELRMIRRLMRTILRHLGKESSPAAGLLTATITPSGASMNAVLVATIPTVREDTPPSPLAPTDIASVTFQKTSLEADGVTEGPFQTLQVNSAVAGAGLQLSDLTFTDTNSAKGDAYSCFFTDVTGGEGALSNIVTNPGVVVPPKPAAPGAGTLSATFN